MARYRLLAGNHRERGRTYRRGEVITTDNDLLKHNHGPNGMKFERLDDRKGEQESLAAYREGYEPDETYKRREPALVPEGGPPSKADQVQINQQEMAKGRELPNPSPNPEQYQPAGKDAAKAAGPKGKGDKDYLARLDKMTEKELREHAAEEEVDVTKARNKDDLLKALKAGL